MAKGKDAKNMRTLTIVDVDTYSKDDLEFMKQALKGLDGENYFLDMAAFMKLLEATIETEKLGSFICTLKQMNMISKPSTE